MERDLFLQLAGLFIITQLLGLYVASNLIAEETEVTLFTEDPDDPMNAIGLVVYIFIVTLVVLAAITFFKKRVFGAFLRLFEIGAIFGTSMIVLQPVLGETTFMFSVLIIASRLALKNNIWLKNATSVLAVAGVGSVLGVGLGVLPVVAFIAMLSIYDIIAVFGTKHMVKMAEAITSQNLAFTFTMPTEKHAFQLGTGDMVIPLVFATAALKYSASKLAFPMFYLPSILLLVASLAGLILTLEYCDKKRVALPALPLQSVFMIAVWVVMWLTFVG